MGGDVRRIIEAKRQWNYLTTEEELNLGFKGWRSRGYLPHFDAPGVRQFLTYFDRYIRDEAHFRKAVRYTENNPVKAGLAREPVGWQWSSARWRDEYCRLRLGERSAGGSPASPCA